MYAGVEETGGGGGAAEQDGGIPYIGFEGSTCKNTERNIKTYFKIKDREQSTDNRLCALQQER